MTIICAKCERPLKADEFYITGEGTRQRACKSCQKRSVAEWRAKNREQHNENASRWRKNNPDKIRATNKAQYKKNREAHYEYGKRWAAANRDKSKQAAARWRAKPSSKELKRLYAIERRRQKPNADSAAWRRWRQKNPHMVCAFAKTRRARKKGAPISDFTAAQWKALQQAFNHRCAYCDRRYKGRLTQDHVVPLSKGGSHTASNIVPACQSCNSKKQTGPPLRPVQVPLLVP